MVRLAWAAAVAVMVFAGSAQAQQGGALEADTRCAMIGLGLAGMENATPEQRQSGTLLALYYIGRVHGRSPGINLEQAIQAQAQGMSLESLQSEGTRCGAEFRTVGEELSAMGQRAQQPAPTP